MTDATTAAAETDFSGERTLRAYWPAAMQDGKLYRLADSLPLGLGLFIYAPMYLIKALNPFGLVRYTLTNRRIRVDKGTLKKTIQSVPLEEIDDVRVTNVLSFTRTGDIELISGGEVLLRMVAVQDPAPAARTIRDAVAARKQVSEILERELAAK